MIKDLVRLKHFFLWMCSKTRTLALKLGTNIKNGSLTASQSLQAIQRSSPVG